jgi:tRNA(fMet)-specific endonuclease VapC
VTAPRYLLDTNILIYIRQNRFADLTARFRGLKPHEAAISVITYGELLHGVAGSREKVRARQILDELCALIPPLTLPTEAAFAYGEVRARLAARGEMIGANDIWIAAHAVVAGLILVTNNTRKFQRVRHLTLENWFPAG